MREDEETLKSEQAGTDDKCESLGPALSEEIVVQNTSRRTLPLPHPEADEADDTDYQRRKHARVVPGEFATSKPSTDQE